VDSFEEHYRPHTYTLVTVLKIGSQVLTNPDRQIEMSLQFDLKPRAFPSPVAYVNTPQVEGEPDRQNHGNG